MCGTMRIKPVWALLVLFSVIKARFPTISHSTFYECKLFYGIVQEVLVYTVLGAQTRSSTVSISMGLASPLAFW